MKKAMPLFISSCVIAFLLVGCTAKITTSIDQYNDVIGKSAIGEYADKWGMSEEIFPENIDGLNTTEFLMVYYDPWDAQYLSKLIITYQPEEYIAEFDRLSRIGISEYKGVYNAEGFNSEYELVAMNADSYQGLVYALTDKKDTIIYIEMIFCNYFMDIDYTKYIEEKYLPLSFDATNDNSYRKMKLKNDSV